MSKVDNMPFRVGRTFQTDRGLPRTPGTFWEMKPVEEMALMRTPGRYWL